MGSILWYSAKYFVDVFTGNLFPPLDQVKFGAGADLHLNKKDQRFFFQKENVLLVIIAINCGEFPLNNNYCLVWGIPKNISIF